MGVNLPEHAHLFLRWKFQKRRDALLLVGQKKLDVHDTELLLKGTPRAGQDPPTISDMKKALQHLLPNGWSMRLTYTGVLRYENESIKRNENSCIVPSCTNMPLDLRERCRELLQRYAKAIHHMENIESTLLRTPESHLSPGLKPLSISIGHLRQFEKSNARPSARPSALLKRCGELISKGSELMSAHEKRSKEMSRAENELRYEWDQLKRSTRKSSDELELTSTQAIRQNFPAFTRARNKMLELVNMPDNFGVTTHWCEKLIRKTGTLRDGWVRRVGTKRYDKGETYWYNVDLEKEALDKPIGDCPLPDLLSVQEQERYPRRTLALCDDHDAPSDIFALAPFLLVLILMYFIFRRAKALNGT